MKEFDEAKRKIDRISPSGTLQTGLVDAMNSLLELCGALMGSQKGSTIDIRDAPGKSPNVEGPKATLTNSKEDPRKNPILKPEEKSKVTDLIDSLSKVKK